MADTISVNYPYDQQGWYLSTQQYYVRMSKYGYIPSDPLYRYVFDTGKTKFIEGSTTIRIYEQEYEAYKASVSPY
ncbi:hypothetical protein AADC60_24475 [Cytobacillus pseudoceanisediminis]|uniref:Uncharacterized protein n=1 Tax=Cytobacillus pseudoceanisediminis TaxID=3051614 RepID=A0ABZ2ZIM0_9BACI